MNVSSCFAALNETERCEAIQQLANIPCAAHGTLIETNSQDGTLQRLKCFLCEGLKPPDSFHLDEERCQKISNEAIATFSNLIKSTAFLDSRRPRVLAMIALRRFTVHFTSPSFIDFEQSVLGQWCLQSLRSSIRELRIAAGYVTSVNSADRYFDVISNVLSQPYSSRILVWACVSS